MEQYKEKFIDFMIESGVLLFGEFVTKSGRHSPYFVNTGNYRTGRQLSMLGKFYAETIKESIGCDNFTLMFGPAYKGIPLVSAASASLYSDFGIDKPYCFNRKEAKDHGEGGTMVGTKPTAGDRVIIVEDVITAGTAVRETLPQLLATEGVTVADMIVSVNRMEKGATSGKTAAQEINEEFGITLHSIVTVKDIMQHVEAHLDSDITRRMYDYFETYCVE